MANAWREDFEILSSEVYGHRLAYLDNAATTQMPTSVRDRMVSYLTHEHANVHRGVHFLSERATESVEAARAHVAAFLGATCPEEVVFTSGATEGLNLVAHGMGKTFGPDATVVVSELEHHSNFVPWQRLCDECGAHFVVWHAQDGDLRMGDLRRLLAKHNVRVVAVTQVSNVTGAVVDLSQVVRAAHEVGALVVADGAQGVLHEGMDVGACGVDFYAFSAHKMCGPTGTGVLYGRRELLEGLEPLRFGGGMVDVVDERHTTYGALPYRLEAGTPNIVGIVGLDAAISYLEATGLDQMRRHERELMRYLVERLMGVEGLRILGEPGNRSAIVSFELEGASAFDVAFLLDKMGVAVRSGHHCAQPALCGLGVGTCVRASLAPYNDFCDVDALSEGLIRIRTLVGA